MFYCGAVRQLSFFSVDARLPALVDLAGLLCGPGQTVRFGRGGAARLSVVVADSWRVRALAAECADRGVDVDLATSDDDGRPLLRTAFRADLADLATSWMRGAVKAVPDGLELDGHTLRLWAQAAGWSDGRGYLLGLDPHAPDTHEPLTAALVRIGLAPVLLGPRGGGPAVRVTGRRRLARLLELVGAAPPGADPDCWPYVAEQVRLPRQPRRKPASQPVGERLGGDEFGGDEFGGAAQDGQLAL